MRDGDAYRLNGSKRFITHGSVANVITVFALTGIEPPWTMHGRDLSPLLADPQPFLGFLSLGYPFRIEGAGIGFCHRTTAEPRNVRRT